MSGPPHPPQEGEGESMIELDERSEKRSRGSVASLLRRRPARVVAVAAAVVAAFLLGRGSRPPASPEHRHTHDTQAVAAQAEGEQRLYTCSMHPQVRSRDPKEKCPLCGMDLIPVPSGGAGDADGAAPRLALSPRSAALLQVATAPVERREVRTSLLLYGTVEVDETRLRHVAAWVPGRLERVFIDQTGVEVRAGDPMVEIYSPPLVAAQEELLQALAALGRLPETAAASHRAGAEALVAAAKDKLRLLGLSAEQVGVVAARGTVEDRITLTAPVGGVVTARDATQGMVVSTGDRIYSIADLSHVWAQLEVHEREVAWVRAGQPVTLTVAAWPGESLAGTVAFVQPVVDEAARTVRVRVHVANRGGRLKPGMFVTGEVRPPAAAGEELVIPATAPLLTGRRAVVYVQGDPREPTFEAREVVLGPRAGDVVVVREGLRAGELVVVRGNFKIDSELQIRGRPSMMAAAGDAAAPHAHHAGAAGGAGRPGQPDAQALPPELGARLGALVQGNFALVKGLSDDDARAAEAAAAALLKAVAEVDDTALPGAVRDVWRPLAARMRAGLKRLLEQGALDDMRPHFETFSEALTEVVRRWGAGVDQPVYRAVCPMVQGRKGYWLQAQTAITNPYHGARMYSCGEIAETLATASAPEGGGRP